MDILQKTVFVKYVVLPLFIEINLMHEYIEMLINSIETYDKHYKPPYFILFYLPANEDFGKYDDTYFAVLAAMIKPTDDMINDILHETKKQVGNMIFAADYAVLSKDDAICQLEESLD